jgi:transposase
MAIAVRMGEQTRQVQMVCLDELVDDDDVLRRVERLVAWDAVRPSAVAFYSDFGRPGVDPVVLVKVFLVAAIRGLGSMRETLRVAQVDLSIRRFLGYGLTEALPHHATFSYAQCVRFAHSSVFEQLFTQVLASCRDAGLLDGSRLIVDATHVEADAALTSLRAELQVIDGDGSDAGDGPVNERPVLALPRPERDRHPSARHLTRPRSRAPIQTPSCATSPVIARIWSIARRSRPIPRPASLLASTPSRRPATRPTAWR